jgi:putative ABC transport system permease protein
VKLFGIIGIFILLLACINFMNLATARSEKRAKEVGIRKSVGSLRKQLATQFFSESLLMAVLSSVFALVLVALFLNQFNAIADKAIVIPWSNPVFSLSIGFFVLLVGLISGIYPAFYLSSFEPLKVLKGTFKAGKNSILPRKVLVSTQFTTSIALIIGTVIVYKQIQHAQDRPLGYDQEQLVSVSINTPDLENVNYNMIRKDLLSTGAVSEFCTVNSPMTSMFNTQVGFNWEGKPNDIDPLFGIITTTHDYVKTAGLIIKDGRDFSRNFSTDSSAKLINVPDIVGKYINWNGTEFKVLGIVQDLVMNSPYEKVQPSFYHINYYEANQMLLRIPSNVSVKQGLEKAKVIFAKHDPGSPFSYEFVDEVYGNKFKSEQQIGKLSMLFAALAIFISCLDIFGLASFMAEQRTKEIGVRKVLGASIINVWRLLSLDFLGLVAIAFFVATPVAYYFLNEWLGNYLYRTNQPWWVFVIAGLGTMLIVLATVSFQSIKAALQNPVESLRSE